ncbi:MAG TPA: oxidoreductase [Methylophilaceae bacterium]|nr:oxidoreductase [Methylophilaceae bacterium]
MIKKVVVVTGASSGIGFATAKMFADKGYEVYGLSRTRIEGAPFNQINVDVNDDASVTAAISEVIKSAEHIDILFNNAGFSLLGATEESSMKQIKSVFETNFFGAVRMVNAVLPIMRGQKSGLIINSSSVAGLVAAPYMAYYAASKHALEAYSESLDHEVRKLGIRSVLIEPGFMKTSLGAHQPVPDNPKSIYTSARKRIEGIVEKGISGSPDPIAVAKKVLCVSKTRCPKVRYTVGVDAKIFTNLRRFLPASLFDSMLRSVYKLNH